MNESEIKAALFEVYSAGYVDCFTYPKGDIKTAFETWYNKLLESEKRYRHGLIRT